MPIRVLLVDSHRLFRAGIRKLLADYPGLTVVDDVGTGEEAIKTFSTLQPDVVVTEVRLSDTTGVEMLRRLRALSNAAQVLFLTTVDSPEVLLSAAEAGGAGYVLKDISPENLVNAIRAVHEGRTMIHPVMARRLLERLEANAKGGNQSGTQGLKDVETSILSSVALGLSDREIAVKLHLSEAAVKKRLRRIYGKLGARNRAQAALLAVQNHLIQ
ncbi:MAG TPA: response regulator transcription factor [Gemmatimonadales bacterium]|nr:response regulator transcription factor [Gemmatimonadales bacterium]